MIDSLIQQAYLLAAAVDPGTLPRASADTNAIKAIMSIFFVLIGAVALAMIVVSGLRYITSAGDPQKASQAKDGVIFALVGLAIAVTAEAIIAFVGNRL